MIKNTAWNWALLVMGLILSVSLLYYTINVPVEKVKLVNECNAFWQNQLKSICPMATQQSYTPKIELGNITIKDRYQ